MTSDTRNNRKYIAVDECQDTDITQFRLLQLLYGGNTSSPWEMKINSSTSGDRRKSGNLTNFARTFPGAKTLYLGANYRSTARLVDFFKKIIPVDNGLASHMVSMRHQGEPVRFIQYRSEDEEANEVLNEIMDRDLIDSAAVIARTNRQLQLIQRRAMSRNIKAEIIGKKNVWQENEVKHLVELLRERMMDPRPAATVMRSLIDEHNMVYRYGNTKGSNTEKEPYREHERYRTDGWAEEQGDRPAADGAGILGVVSQDHLHAPHQEGPDLDPLHGAPSQGSGVEERLYSGLQPRHDAPP